MNERIKEIELEAAYGTINPNGPFTPEEFIKFTDKFAELIVQECIDTMYKHGEKYAHPSAGFYQAKTFSEAIMKHFGVEE
jgi:hypothetical protein